MFTIEDIPEEFVEDDEKIQFIKEKISKKYNLLTKRAKTATELEIKIGEMFNALKPIAKKNGEKWNAYIEENFPYMNVRTAQRWMKLARTIDIEIHPRLAYAGQTRLLTLANIAKRNDSEVHVFLKDNGISLDFKTKKSLEIRRFRDKIDDLIKKQSKSPKKGAKTTATDIINRILKTAKELTKKLEDTVDDEEVTEEVDKKTLKNSIDEVKELLKQLRQIKNKYSDSSRKRKKAA